MIITEPCRKYDNRTKAVHTSKTFFTLGCNVKHASTSLVGVSKKGKSIISIQFIFFSFFNGIYL